MSEDVILNYYEDIEVGQKAVFAKTITEADILMFSGVSGDTNPVHLNQEYAEGTMFKGRIAHGMLSAALISTVFGTKLPGPGCIYVGQSLKFKAPCGPAIRLPPPWNARERWTTRNSAPSTPSARLLASLSSMVRRPLWCHPVTTPSWRPSNRRSTIFSPSLRRRFPRLRSAALLAVFGILGRGAGLRLAPAH